MINPEGQTFHGDCPRGRKFVCASMRIPGLFRLTFVKCIGLSKVLRMDLRGFRRTYRRFRCDHRNWSCSWWCLPWGFVALGSGSSVQVLVWSSFLRPLLVWITGSGVMAAGLSVYPPNIHVSRRHVCGHIIRSLYPDLHHHRTHAATQRKLQCQETSQFVCDLLGMSVAVRRPPIKPICVLREEEQ